MIPKTIHQIHIGDTPLSQQELLWQKTWLDKNPNWSHVLWDDTRIEKELNITHPEVLNNCKNFSEKSDVIRFEILYQFGGLYIDTDFECLKNIDPLFVDKSIVLYRQKHNMICGAFFGATQGNADVKRLIDNLPDREKSHGDLGSHAKYGPKYITQTLGINTGLPDGDCSEKKTVYPYLWEEQHRATEDFTKTHPEAYAVHHWSSSWWPK